MLKDKLLQSNQSEPVADFLYSLGSIVNNPTTVGSLSKDELELFAEVKSLRMIKWMASCEFHPKFVTGNTYT